MADFDLSFLQRSPALLPISKHKQSLQYAVEKYPVLIVVGQTGSGKTTQIPQFLHEAGWCADGKLICVTQPRRVAAVTVASRVAEEMRCTLGEEVGYSIRFDEKTSFQTKIKFSTDGMLLREILSDPLLSRYSVIMIDEAHERSLNSDILLGLLREIRGKRPELRIVVSSATIDSQSMAAFFRTSESEDGVKIVALDGRTFPVDVQYLEQSVEDYITTAVEVVVKIHKQEADGDILVFLTGRDDIRKCLQLVSDYATTILPTAQALQPLPLFAGLSQAEQMYVFSPAAENTRKVILSTNVAEASVTIDGIAYVVDCGLAKLRTYNVNTNIETLAKVPVSQASATQRAGRAGRTRPGKCYRLYTEATHRTLPVVTCPEIQRVDLAPIILQLKALGIENIATFPYLSAPSAKLTARGLEVLYSLGALDDQAKLTAPLGSRMAELALPPMMSKALLSAATEPFDCLSEMLTIAAMTSLQADGNTSIWFSHEGQRKALDMSRRKFAAEEGDHITYLNVYQAFVNKGQQSAKWCQQHHLSYQALNKATSIRLQLKLYLQRLGIVVNHDAVNNPTHDTTGRTHQKTPKILQCLTAGYFMQAARMNPTDGVFRPISSAGRNSVLMHAHPTSLMFNRKADYVIFHELLETGDKIYIKEISKIEKSWLTDYSGGYYKVANAA